MISRRLKATYFALMRLPMRASAEASRMLRGPGNSALKVQLGPGEKNYLPGWTNVDANPFARKDVWADIRDPLPFNNDSVDAIYSHHVIEHLPDASLSGHFAEMYRCLKVGGIFRVGGPNGDVAVKKFLERDDAWFGDWPDKRTSTGGRLVNFLLCRGEHLTILTDSYLRELAGGAGFRNLRSCAPVTETGHPSIMDAAVLALESEPTPEAPHTLILEGQKP